MLRILLVCKLKAPKIFIYALFVSVGESFFLILSTFHIKNRLYFVDNRFRCKSHRRASSKTIIFGILDYINSVYVENFPNASKAVLQITIFGKMAPENIIHTDG